MVFFRIVLQVLITVGARTRMFAAHRVLPNGLCMVTEQGVPLNGITPLRRYRTELIPVGASRLAGPRPNHGETIHQGGETPPLHLGTIPTWANPAERDRPYIKSFIQLTGIRTSYFALNTVISNLSGGVRAGARRHRWDPWADRIFL